MNKIALVTGGARGLGEQIVRSFLDKDYKVVINFYKSEKKAKKLSDEFGENVLIVQADISQNKDIKNIEATQNTFNHRAKMCTLAAQGKWSSELENK